MTLTEKDKKRIIEEEEFRSKTRKDFTSRNIRSTFTNFVLIIILICIIGFLGNGLLSNKDNNLNHSISLSPALIQDPNKCNRTTPYENPPDLERGLSLYLQRVTPAFRQVQGIDIMDWKNCLDIQFETLPNNTEGMFVFDNDKSSLQDLKIYVDTSYKEKDDVLTSILLSHELNHALYYIVEKTQGNISGFEGKNPTTICMIKEEIAFTIEVYFLKDLNSEERSTLNTRIVDYLTGTYSKTSPNYRTIESLSQLVSMHLSGFNSCSAKYKQGTTNFNDCWAKEDSTRIISYVTSNPYYRKECGL